MKLKEFLDKAKCKKILHNTKDMFINLLKKIKYKFLKIKVFALIGPAGTGKSFRAHLIADTHKIPLIIDDGVLIRGMNIIAGRSAKFEDNIIGAVRKAIFEDDKHRGEVVEVLKKEDFNKILILGTSLKMIDKIIDRLYLPKVGKIIYITDIATKQEIERAKMSRQMGEHVIAAAAFEITSLKPNIFLDSIMIFLKGKGLFSKKKNYIKSVVKPHFQEEGVLSISKEAVQQIIEHCISEYNRDYILYSLKIKKKYSAYSFKIYLDLPFNNHLLNDTDYLRDYMHENILKYTIIQISTIDIIIHKLYKKEST